MFNKQGVVQNAFQITTSIKYYNAFINYYFITNMRNL